MQPPSEGHVPTCVVPPNHHTFIQQRYAEYCGGVDRCRMYRRRYLRPRFDWRIDDVAEHDQEFLFQLLSEQGFQYSWHRIWRREFLKLFPKY